MDRIKLEAEVERLKNQELINEINELKANYNSRLTAQIEK